MLWTVLVAFLLMQNDHSWSKHRVSQPSVATTSKTEILNTARYLETAFYILTFYVLAHNMYFNLNNFNDMAHRLTVLKS
jgi:hypothetical protein